MLFFLQNKTNYVNSIFKNQQKISKLTKKRFYGLASAMQKKVGNPHQASNGKKAVKAKQQPTEK